MDRSRSKRSYYYGQEYDFETLPRTKQRHNDHFSHRRGATGSGRSSKPPDSSSMVTTSYRILCHDIKAGGVIGKSGSIIKAIRQHTGAWINVHELIPGDEERVIEISDTRRRDPEGRMPSFSPAQEALFLIHERILESDGGFGMGFSGDDEEDRGPRGSAGGGNKVATRLVVSRMHVGCLLGKGGKIIEQMRIETKTQIRILPRDHNLPRCVSVSEEIVQVVGDVNAVKNAIAIISARLRESQHRDRSQYGRLHSSDQSFSLDDDFVTSPMSNPQRRSSIDGPTFGSRLSASSRNNSFDGYPSDYNPMVDKSQPFLGEDLVFRILCPIDRVDSVIGQSNGIIELLQNEIGVDVKVTDPDVGSNEQIIIVSSDEGPNDNLFPAQEALLHIQTRIVDLVPDKDNIITTRLLLSSSEIGCFEGRDNSLSEMRRMTGANIQILPREERPLGISGADELLQIVGEIKAAREALVEVTSRLRSHIYGEFFQTDTIATAFRVEAASPSKITPPREVYPTATTELPATTTYQSVAPQPKDNVVSAGETAKQNETGRREDLPGGLNRIPVPLVTRSTLEVVIPDLAVPKLITRSKNKLAQISELSGTNVTLVEDRPEIKEKIIQISGTPEQAERAQSLLQGFILSTQEDI